MHRLAQRAVMIGRGALGRAPLLACPRSFAARGSFARGHRCSFPYIDDVNIRLTGVAFAASRIFTLSTFGTQYKREFVSVSIGASNIAIATKFRDPGHLSPDPPTGFARGRFFTSKSRPQRWHRTVRSEWRDGYRIVTVLRGFSKPFSNCWRFYAVMIGIGDSRPGGKPGRPSDHMSTFAT
jgi:hypothetical protein